MVRAPILAVLLAAPILADAGQSSRGQTSRARASAASVGALTELENAETVSIGTRDELELSASYFAPRNKKQLAPAALLVHDAGRSRAQLMTIAQRLWKSNFAVLVIDVRGHGGSRTESTDWTQLDEEGQAKLWAIATRDLEAAASWLRKRKEVHSTNLNLVGAGAGCALAVRHAARDENVRAIALLAPAPEQFGFDVAGEIQDLGGLPTWIVSRKAERTATEAMVQEAHQASGGHPYIDLMFCSAKPEQEVVADKRATSQLVKWLKEKAFPRRRK